MADSSNKLKTYELTNPMETFPGLTIDDLNRYLPAIRTVEDMSVTIDNMQEGMFLTKCIDGLQQLPDESIDSKLGGITFVLVGYIEERKMFIAATTFGKNYGTNGFILIPYDYILLSKYTSELYTLDFKKERVEGYINQRKEMVNLQNDKIIHDKNKKQYEKDSFGGLFQ